MSSALLTQARTFCYKYHLFQSGDIVVIAVSGGADSVCLWHVLRTLQSEWALTLIVAHLNHGLRGAAAIADEQFVRQLAAQWQTPLYVEQADIAALAVERKESLETTARQVRYEFLQRIARQTQATKIAVAHHANDQAETVFMRLLRGTGARGLRGMLPTTPLGEGHHSLTVIRPLLATSRHDIEAYLGAESLPFCHDESNFDVTFWRNRVRHEILPYLRRYNPNLDQALTQLAQITMADVAWLDHTLDEMWSTLLVTQTPHRLEFSRVRWATLPLALQRLALRRAMQSLVGAGRELSFEHVEHAIDLLARYPTGAQLTWPHDLTLTIGYETWALFQAKTQLIQAQTPEIIASEPVAVVLPGVTPLPHSAWQLEAHILPLNEAILSRLKLTHPWEAYLDAAKVNQPLILRSRQQGDKFAPWGGHGQFTKLKNFMINAKIPLAQRNFIPLLVAQSRIVWVCGYRLAHEVAVQATSQQVIHLSFTLMPSSMG